MFQGGVLAPSSQPCRISKVLRSCNGVHGAYVCSRSCTTHGERHARRQARTHAPRRSKEDPEGNIVIVVAENKLSTDLVHERLLQCPPPPAEMLCYPDSWTGHLRLRKALAALLGRTFMKGISVEPGHITLQSGAGAIIDNLFWCIGEAGQGVLIPAPYYPAFDNDLGVKCEMVPVPFEFDEAKDVAQQLSMAAAAAEASGSPIKVLLLTNPNNPLSTMYKRGTLVACLRWCMERSLHLVCDEVYALSIWGEGAPAFQSIECIAREEAAGMPGGEARVRQLLHVVFGMSKDFCVSGLRMGCLHSRNAVLNKAIDNLSYFCNVSGHTQYLWTQLMEDVEWVDGFLLENARRLRHSFSLLAGALTEADIPFVQANSAMFCWIDLRAALHVGEGHVPTWEDEHQLWQELSSKHGVLITPGQSCHACEPGFFRLCWAWVPAEALPVAVRRIKAAMDKRRGGAAGAAAPSSV